MKRKTLLISLVLTLSLIFSSVATVFAATEAEGPANDKTRDALVPNRSISIENGLKEQDVEAVAKALSDQVTEGKYKLISTDELAKKYKDVVIVDTMPAGWWTERHIPGAINQVVGETGPKFEITAGQQKELLAKVKAAVGTKKVTYYWNSKSKKWVTKKPAAKYYKKCTKKGDKHKGKKSYTVNEVNKNATVVVYCGFTKCQRSHQAAMYLTKQGYKNVYRYAGGIAAWVDAGNPISGNDLN